MTKFITYGNRICYQIMDTEKKNILLSCTNPVTYSNRIYYKKITIRNQKLSMINYVILVTKFVTNIYIYIYI